MEIERVVKNLEFKNDINQLSEEELTNKYTATDVDALYFLHMFYNTFVGKTRYPLMIYDRYETVKHVIDNILFRYGVDSKFKGIASDIKDSIAMEEHFAGGESSKHERYSEQYYMFEYQLGSLKANKSKKYSEIVTDLYEETKKINECYKANKDFPNDKDYALMLSKAAKEQDPFKELEVIDAYYEKFPLLKLCHEKEFLYAFNYLMGRSDVEGKDELVALAENVMSFSQGFRPYQKDCDLVEYGKIAKVARKTISAYRKTEEGKKTFEPGIVKRYKR